MTATRPAPTATTRARCPRCRNFAAIWELTLNQIGTTTVNRVRVCHPCREFVTPRLAGLGMVVAREDRIPIDWSRDGA